MLIRKIKEFHRRTMERYEEGLSENREPWMEEVMALHDQAAFLFYYEDCDYDEEDIYTLHVTGSLVRDCEAEEFPVVLYDGKGVLIGDGYLFSRDEEGEKKHKSLFTPKRQICEIQLDHLFGENLEEIDDAGILTLKERFCAVASLILATGDEPILQ